VTVICPESIRLFQFNKIICIYGRFAQVNDIYAIELPNAVSVISSSHHDRCKVV